MYRPTIDNTEKLEEEFSDRVTLYRGLGLPKDAIETYEEFLKTKEKF